MVKKVYQSEGNIVFSLDERPTRSPKTKQEQCRRSESNVVKLAKRDLYLEKQSKWSKET